jgi:hypothetical protein
MEIIENTKYNNIDILTEEDKQRYNNKKIEFYK